MKQLRFKNDPKFKNRTLRGQNHSKMISREDKNFDPLSPTLRDDRPQNNKRLWIVDSSYFHVVSVDHPWIMEALHFYSTFARFIGVRCVVMVNWPFH